MASRADDKVHFDLSMSREANNAIEQIATAKSVSPGEVLTRAVALIIEIEDKRRKGETLGLFDAEKKPVVEFVGF